MTKDKSNNKNTVSRDPALHEGHRKRLRRKVDNDCEFKTFADHEVLEFILSLVIPRRDTNELAHRLIREFGSFTSVFFASSHQLFKVKGMTESASYLLPIMMPVARRVLTYSRAERRGDNYDTPKHLLSYMHSYFIGRNTEVLILFLFDNAYRIVHVHIYDSSSPVGVTLTTEDVVKRVLNEGASFVTLAHNHPNGDVSPSDDDINLTSNVFSALKSINVKLLDHAIYYEDKVFSFRASKLLDKFANNYKDEKDKRTVSAYKKERELFVTDLITHYINPQATIKEDAFIADSGKEIWSDYLASITRDEIEREFMVHKDLDDSSDEFIIGEEILTRYDAITGEKLITLDKSFRNQAVERALRKDYCKYAYEEEVAVTDMYRDDDYPDDF